MKEFKKYLLTFVIGLIIAFTVIAFKDTFNLTDKKEILRNICDGFFVSATIIGGLGLLVFVSNEGAFDMISFGLISFFSMFKAKKERKYASYFDYKESKAKEKIKSGFILYVGLILLLITLVLCYAYNKL